MSNLGLDRPFISFLVVAGGWSSLIVVVPCCVFCSVVFFIEMVHV